MLVEDGCVLRYCLRTNTVVIPCFLGLFCYLLSTAFLVSSQEPNRMQHHGIIFIIINKVANQCNIHYLKMCSFEFRKQGCSCRLWWLVYKMVNIFQELRICTHSFTNTIHIGIRVAQTLGGTFDKLRTASEELCTEKFSIILMNSQVAVSLLVKVSGCDGRRWVTGGYDMFSAVQNRLTL